MAERDIRGTTGGSATPEQIAERAYQRFVERGGESGRDVEDWLEAERELRESEGHKADEKAGGRKGGRKSAV